MKKCELVSIILDLRFALSSVVAFIKNEHMYSGKKVKEVITDKKKLLKIKAYLSSDVYKEDKTLDKKFTLARINDKLFSKREMTKGYHLKKRTAPLNRMKVLG